MRLINTEIMRHWENWFIVTLMLLVALIAADIVVSYFSSKPSTTET